MVIFELLLQIKKSQALGTCVWGQTKIHSYVAYVAHKILAMLSSSENLCTSHSQKSLPVKWDGSIGYSVCQKSFHEEKQAGNNVVPALFRRNNSRFLTVLMHLRLYAQKAPSLHGRGKFLSTSNAYYNMPAQHIIDKAILISSHNVFTHAETTEKSDINKITKSYKLLHRLDCGRQKGK